MKEKEGSDVGSREGARAHANLSCIVAVVSVLVVIAASASASAIAVSQLPPTQVVTAWCDQTTVSDEDTAKVAVVRSEKECVTVLPIETIIEPIEHVGSYGYGSEIISKKNVIFARRALGAPDGKGALMFGDAEIVIKLGKKIPECKKVSVWARRLSGFSPEMYVYVSSNDSTWTKIGSVIICDSGWQRYDFSCDEENVEYIRIRKPPISRMGLDAVYAEDAEEPIEPVESYGRAVISMENVRFPRRALGAPDEKGAPMFGNAEIVIKLDKKIPECKKVSVWARKRISGFSPEMYVYVSSNDSTWTKIGSVIICDSGWQRYDFSCDKENVDVEYILIKKPGSMMRPKMMWLDAVYAEGFK